MLGLELALGSCLWFIKQKLGLALGLELGLALGLELSPFNQKKVLGLGLRLWLCLNKEMLGLGLWFELASVNWKLELV